MNRVENLTDRIYSLQALRAFAFLCIFSSHCDVSSLGACGVSIFVLLSGFVMVYTYYDRILDNSFKGCIKFSVRKVKKLYFLHILMLLCAVVLEIPGLKAVFSTRTVILFIVKIFANVFLLQSWFPNSQIYFSMNGVAWYLSVCVFLYAVFPLILNGLKCISSFYKAVVSAILIFTFQCLIGFMLQYTGIQIMYVDNPTKWITYILPLFRLGDFTIGCCFGYIYVNKKICIKRMTATIMEIIAIMFLIMAECLRQNRFGISVFESFRYSILFTPAAMALIYIFAENKGAISKIVTCKPIVYLGNISGYAFLIHQIVIRYLSILYTKLNGEELNKWIMLFVSLFITILCSEIYMKFERCYIGKTK